MLYVVPLNSGTTWRPFRCPRVPLWPGILLWIWDFVIRCFQRNAVFGEIVFCDVSCCGFLKDLWKWIWFGEIFHVARWEWKVRKRTWASRCSEDSLCSICVTELKKHVWKSSVCMVQRDSFPSVFYSAPANNVPGPLSACASPRSVRRSRGLLSTSAHASPCRAFCWSEDPRFPALRPQCVADRLSIIFSYAS